MTKKRLTRMEAYEKAKSLGLGSRASSFVGSEKRLKEVEKIVKEFGTEKANEVVSNLYSKKGDLSNVLNGVKEMNKIIKIYEEKRIEKLGELPGKLTTTEKAKLRKMIKEGKTPKEIEKKASERVIDKASRQKKFLKYQSDGGKMSKKGIKEMNRINDKHGYPDNHPFGFRVVGLMERKGLTEKEATNEVKKFIDKKNANLLHRDKDSL